MKIKILVFVFLISLNLEGCFKSEAPGLPELQDPPKVLQVTRSDLEAPVPAYGIALGGGPQGVQFEVNIEAADASQVRPGQRATATVIPQKTPIRCEVTRVLKNVSHETGQALAWVRPLEKTDKVPTGEFVFVNIITQVKHRVITVPQSAILTRNGHRLVIREEKGEGGKLEYKPVEVKVGTQKDIQIEILSGLSVGDHVITQGGIGYLYPDFKSNQGD